MNTIIKEGTKAIFRTRGWAYELAYEMNVSVETVENLDGAEIIVGTEALDGYYDIHFPKHFDNDGQTITVDALSEEHIEL